VSFSIRSRDIICFPLFSYLGAFITRNEAPSVGSGEVFSMKLKRPGRNERDSNYGTVYFSCCLPLSPPLNLARSELFIMWVFMTRRHFYTREYAFPRDNWKMLPAARLTTKSDDHHRIQITMEIVRRKGYNLCPVFIRGECRVEKRAL